MKTTIENTKPDDKELQTMLDSYYNYNSNYPEGLYIADETGKLWKASDSAMSESDPVNSVWYQEGLTRVNMAIGSSYVNSEGVSVITVSYTHLDVYKRQRHPRSHPLMWRIRRAG